MSALAEEAARTGADLLDRVGPPNWRRRIDLERLNIGSERDCVIGQVFPKEGFGEVMLRLKISGRRQYGFVAIAPERGFAELNEAWRTMLRA